MSVQTLPICKTKYLHHRCFLLQRVHIWLGCWLTLCIHSTMEACCSLTKENYIRPFLNPPRCILNRGFLFLAIEEANGNGQHDSGK